MFRWMMGLALLLVVASLGLAAWRMAGVDASDHAGRRDGGLHPGGTMQAQRFDYTEVQHGTPLYRLSGEEMHDEAGALGAMRVAAVRVIKLKKVELSLLQPKVAGWLLTAEQGQWVAGSRQLSLWGDVRGVRKQGGSLRAGRVLVDPRSGAVTLQDGYQLDVGGHHERGITTELSDPVR